jgi:eukaryotic-like serine/threonine-protein kinase
MTATDTPRTSVTTAPDKWVPPAPGRLVGDRYQLIEQVGRGGTSVVWRAHDDVLDRPVAVKMLSHIDDEPLRRRLQREARACGRFNHPRIAQVFDYGESGTAGTTVTPYIVMELVDGEPLSQRLANGAALDWTAAASIAGQIAEALRAAHARGLVHRDIKPGNVMITRNGVKLVDFGICAAIGSPDADDNGILLGTPAYVSPERIIDAPVDAAADIYALGVLLYRMLTGAQPWQASTGTGLIAAHMWTEPAPLPPIDGLPPQLAGLCMACMDKQPHQRPSSAEVSQVLAQVAGRPSVLPVSGDDGATDAVGDTDNLDDVTNNTLDLARADTPTKSWTGRVRAVTTRHTRRRRYGFALLIVVTATALLTTVWASGGTSARATNTTAAAVPCTAAFSVLRDWGSGFTANLSVTNTSGVGVHVQQLAFTFPGQQSLQPDPRSGYRSAAVSTDGPAYTVTMTQTGTTVIARSQAEPLLRPGTAVTVPIHASYAGANPLPLLFSLNEHPCQVRIAGASSPTLPPISSLGTGTGPTTSRARPPVQVTATPTAPTEHGHGHGKLPENKGKVK